MTATTGAKPNHLAKEAGIKNLKTVVEKTGVSYQTLRNWHKSRPELFQVICLGVLFLEKSERVNRKIEEKRAKARQAFEDDRDPVRE